jgi:hypothetical protein
MEHLKASALFLKVQTLQSQKLSSVDVEGPAPPGGATTPLEERFRLKSRQKCHVIESIFFCKNVELLY